MYKLGVALLILSAFACRSTTMQSAAVDHIMLGAPNLERAMAAFEAATGVKPMRGGQHPGRGTQNALVSLGDGTYLEIIAPQDPPDAVNETVKELQSLSEPTVIGWAARVADVATARAALERERFMLSQSRAGSRVTPAGNRLEWTTFGIDSPQIAAAPFFIRWSDSTVHPSQTSPAGCSIVSFDVADPNSADLNRLLAAGGITIRAQSADRARLSLGLRCGSRTAEFSSR